MDAAQGMRRWGGSWARQTLLLVHIFGAGCTAATELTSAETTLVGTQVTGEVNESGGAATLTVVLSTPPTAAVDIDAASSNPQEVLVAPARVSFTPENWNQPQQIVLTGQPDDIADGPQEVQIRLTISSTDSALSNAPPIDLTVTNYDAQSGAFVVTPVTGTITEAGGAGFFMVSLNKKPAATVTLAPLESQRADEVVVEPAELVFSAQEYQLPQLVMVRGRDDQAVDGDQTVVIDLGVASSQDSTFAGIAPPPVVVVNLDDDEPGLVVSPLTDGVRESGTVGHVAISLRGAPKADVLLTGISSTDAGEIVVRPTSLVFTPQNWQQAQLLTLVGQDDDEADGPQRVALSLGTVQSDDTGFAALSPGYLFVVNEDDEQAGLAVEPQLFVTDENGATESVGQVRLTSQPRGQVRVALTTTAATECSVSPAELIFTPDNWRQAQIFSVRGVDDGRADGLQLAHLVLTAQSPDSAYQALLPVELLVSNLDDESVADAAFDPASWVDAAAPALEAAQVVVSPVRGAALESGAMVAVLTLKLTRAPSAEVTLEAAATPASELKLTPAVLIFDADNWHVPQSVVAVAVDDALADGTQAVAVAFTVSSADAAYAQGVVPPVMVPTVDNEEVAIFTSVKSLVTREGGPGKSMWVRLNAPPTQPVTLTPISQNLREVVVQPARLTFTARDWHLPQMVTVTGQEDRAADGAQTTTVVLRPSVSGDSRFDALAELAVDVTNEDVDVADLLVTPASAAVSEAGTTAQVLVRLSAAPAAAVQFQVASSDAGEVTVAPAELEFTPTNWNSGQFVTLTGQDDVLLDGERRVALLIQSTQASPGAFAGLKRIVLLSNADDDVAALNVVQLSEVTDESGGQAAFSVRLTAAPLHEVLLPLISSEDPGEITVTPALLSFTPENFDTPQIVTVTGQPDGINDGDQRVLVNFATTVSADTGFHGVATPALMFVNRDVNPPVCPAIPPGTGSALSGFAAWPTTAAGREHVVSTQCERGYGGSAMRSCSSTGAWLAIEASCEELPLCPAVVAGQESAASGYARWEATRAGEIGQISRECAAGYRGAAVRSCGPNGAWLQADARCEPITDCPAVLAGEESAATGYARWPAMGLGLANQESSACAPGYTGTAVRSCTATGLWLDATSSCTRIPFCPAVLAGQEDAASGFAQWPDTPRGTVGVNSVICAAGYQLSASGAVVRSCLLDGTWAAATNGCAWIPSCPAVVAGEENAASGFARWPAVEPGRSDVVSRDCAVGYQGMAVRSCSAQGEWQVAAYPGCTPIPDCPAVVAGEESLATGYARWGVTPWGTQNVTSSACAPGYKGEATRSCGPDGVWQPASVTCVPITNCPEVVAGAESPETGFARWPSTPPGSLGEKSVACDADHMDYAIRSCDALGVWQNATVLCTVIPDCPAVFAGEEDENSGYALWPATPHGVTRTTDQCAPTYKGEATRTCGPLGTWLTATASCTPHDPCPAVEAGQESAESGFARWPATPAGTVSISSVECATGYRGEAVRGCDVNGTWLPASDSCQLIPDCEAVGPGAESIESGWAQWQATPPGTLAATSTTCAAGYGLGEETAVVRPCGADGLWRQATNSCMFMSPCPAVVAGGESAATGFARWPATGRGETVTTQDCAFGYTGQATRRCSDDGVWLDAETACTKIPLCPAVLANAADAFAGFAQWPATALGATEVRSEECAPGYRGYALRSCGVDGQWREATPKCTLIPDCPAISGTPASADDGYAVWAATPPGRVDVLSIGCSPGYKGEAMRNCGLDGVWSKPAVPACTAIANCPAVGAGEESLSTGWARWLSTPPGRSNEVSKACAAGYTGQATRTCDALGEWQPATVTCTPILRCPAVTEGYESLASGFALWPATEAGTLNSTAGTCAYGYSGTATRSCSATGVWQSATTTCTAVPVPECKAVYPGAEDEFSGFAQWPVTPRGTALVISQVCKFGYGGEARRACGSDGHWQQAQTSCYPVADCPADTDGNSVAAGFARWPAVTAGTRNVVSLECIAGYRGQATRQCAPTGEWEPVASADACQLIPPCPAVGAGSETIASGFAQWPETPRGTSNAQSSVCAAGYGLASGVLATRSCGADGLWRQATVSCAFLTPCPAVVAGQESAASGYAQWGATQRGLADQVSVTCAAGYTGQATRSCGDDGVWAAATASCTPVPVKRCPSVLAGQENAASGYAQWPATVQGTTQLTSSFCAKGYTGQATRSCDSEGNWLDATASCTLIAPCPAVDAAAANASSGYALWPVTPAGRYAVVSTTCMDGFTGTAQRDCDERGEWQPATVRCQEITDCPPVLANQVSLATGWAEWEATAAGWSDRTTLSCAPGYTGEATRSCSATGTWLPATAACTPIPRCPAIGVGEESAASGFARWSETLPNTPVVTSTACAANYRGTARRACDANGVWQPAAVSCTAIADCPPVFLGQEDAFSGFARWDRGELGSTGNQSSACKVGYTGTAVRSCGADGVWAPADPTCTKIPDCPAVVGGSEDEASGFARWPATLPGTLDVISRECAPGYKGAAQRSCGTDGAWLAVSAACVPVTPCPAVSGAEASLESGFAEWPAADPGTVDVMPVQCAPGYTGGTNTRRTCNSQGEWENATAACRLITDCPAVVAGSEDATSGFARWLPALPGQSDITSDQCKFGYHGSATRSCQADGTWTPAVPACEPNGSCPAVQASLEAPETGLANWPETLSGTVAESQDCLAGYTGKAQRTCLADGTWEYASVACVPIKDCPAVGENEESAASGFARWSSAGTSGLTNIVSTTCRTGYKGSATRSCGADGTWAPATVSCTPIEPCPAVLSGEESLESGYAQWRTTSYGFTETSTVCKKGYFGQPTRVCSPTGEWETATDPCVPFDQCGAVLAGEENEDSGFARWPSTPAGSSYVTSSECAPGYTGAATRSCGDGVWEKASVACTKIPDCPAVPAGSESSLTGYAQWAAAAPGTAGEFLGCKFRYSGTPARLCGADGRWSDATEPCTPIPPCPAIDVADETTGYARWPSTPAITPDATSISCGAGRTGTATRDCDATGQWGPIKTACQLIVDCTPVLAGAESADSGQAQWDFAVAGQWATSTVCKTGYTGFAVRRCGDDGAWEPAMESCTPIPPCPAVLAGSESLASGAARWPATAFGTTASVDSSACAEGFTGGATRTCNAFGVWQNATVSCVQPANVFAGGRATCAVMANGAMRCWGRNAAKQLGQDTTQNIGDNELPPWIGTVDVGGALIRQIAVGYDHICALAHQGTVRCWGTFTNGKVGYGAVTDYVVDVGGPAKQIAASDTHTCVVLNSGGVRCWGANNWGQLGYGNTQDVGDNEAPAAKGDISIGGTATQVAVGSGHTCVLLSTGQVRCFGRADFGQLGYGNTNQIGDNELPSAVGVVSVGATVLALYAGGQSTCAIVSGNNVRCWGRGDEGQLGYGRFWNDYPNPTRIGDNDHPSQYGNVNVGSTVQSLVMGYIHVCAVQTDGKVRCWGYSNNFQVGYGNQATYGDDEQPAQYGTLNFDGLNVARMAAGEYHNCALLTTDAVRCWGLGNEGQLGQGGTGHVTAPSGTGGQQWRWRCGDNVRQSDEECDRGDLAGKSCQALGFAGGSLVCTENCNFDLTSCQAAAAVTCGNGVIDAGEECDGSQLGSRTCAGEGYAGGELACMPGCYLDTSACQVTMAAGDRHTCFTLDNGFLRCFGDNTNGQLGLSTTRTPIGRDEMPMWAGNVDVGGDVPRQIAMGAAFTCGIFNAGSVRCWGYNGLGQLGLRNTAQIGDNETPAAVGYVQLGQAARQVSSSGSHSCAVVESGRAFCWGSSANGQLGLGINTPVGDNETPLEAGALAFGNRRVRQVAAGGYHSCALLDNGAVRCWGGNDHGQLGLGHIQQLDVGYRETPLFAGDVNLGGPARQVVAGHQHTCALLYDGRVRCWGNNTYGQLGYGNNTTLGDNETPATAGDVAVGGTVKRLIAYSFQNCAVLTNNSLVCWGRNDQYQLGNGNTDRIGDNETPAARGALMAGAAVRTGSVAVGWHHTCAWMQSGPVRCWGMNENGYSQLGLGLTWNQLNYQTQAATGNLWRPRCGDGVLDAEEPCDGQLLGAGTCASVGYAGGTLGCSPVCTLDRTLCTPVATCGDGVRQAPEECDGADLAAQSCQSRGYLGGTLRCMSGCYFDEAGCDVTVSAGNQNTCVVLAGGGLRCWGNNDNWQLGYPFVQERIGDNEFIVGAGFVNVGAAAVRQIVQGSVHTCALQEGGSVRCWGRPDEGQTGYGNKLVVGDNEHPGSVAPLDLGGPVVQISTQAQGQHTCAVLASGALVCWGKNETGQLGLGTNTTIGDDETPRFFGRVNLGSVPVRQVAAGGYHTCALLANGAVRCWGGNDYGQLGMGHVQSFDWGYRELPLRHGDVEVGGRVRQIVAGYQHTCALMEDGAVRCWGRADYGQLGYGNTNRIGDDEMPSAAGNVPVGGSVARLSAGNYHTCAVLSSGSLRCWGNNDNGMLGYNNGQRIGDNETPASIGDLMSGVAVSLSGVALGSGHTCTSLRQDNALYCWGLNSRGELGQGNTTQLNAAASGYVPTATCGDGVRNGRDECEGSDFGTASCADFGFGRGSLTCTPSCTLSFEACLGAASCGDGVRQDPEECDGADLAQQTCASRGYRGGTLSCMKTCYFNYAACDEPLAVGFQRQCFVMPARGLRCWGSSAHAQLGYPGAGSIGDNELVPYAGEVFLEGLAVRQVSGGNGDFGGLTPYNDWRDLTCALLSNNNVRCWGNNGHGQLGLNNYNRAIGDDETPAAAAYLNLGGPVQQIAAKPGISCAVLQSGELRCWGRNDYGQLGLGHTRTIGDDEFPSVAGQIPLSTPVQQVAVGLTHACVVFVNGSLRCWGNNGNGQLGYANTQSWGEGVSETVARNGDVRVGGPVRKVALGNYHTCALLVGGTVRCWGRASEGQLGYANNIQRGDDETPASLSNVDVGGVVTDIDAGSYYTCARLSDGTARCWGQNNYGQLGYNHTSTIGLTQTPAAAGNIAVTGSITRVVTGSYTTCALLAAGGVRCWGRGDIAGLGHGVVANLTAPNAVNVPRLFCGDGIAQADEECDGGDFGGRTCASEGFTGGDLSCTVTCQLDRDTCRAAATCGDGRGVIDEGEECDGTNFGGRTCASEGFGGGSLLCTDRCTVDTTPCLSTVAVGGRHTCAIFGNRQMRCWGNNDQGQLSNSSGVRIGDNEPVELGPPAILPASPAVIQVAAGFQHTCLLFDTGEVRCLGRNDYGQLGILTTGNFGLSQRPTSIPAINLGGAARQIAAGENHTCAVLSNGVLRCWGRGDSGQLGNGPDVATPIGDNEAPASWTVPVGHPVRQVAAGSNHTCAVLTSGALRCWGDNSSGQLGYASMQTRFGDGYNEVPWRTGDVNVGGPVRQVVTGARHTCALLESGTVRCWGRATEGQLGYGNATTLGDNETPATVSAVNLGGGTVKKLMAGSDFTCALMRDGVLRCWGQGYYGQLGLGATNDIGNDAGEGPTVVNVGGAVADIAATSSGLHMCAALSDGRLFCWGLNDNGQLGRGNTTQVNTAANGAVTGWRCGDGVRDADELCDGSDVGTLTCAAGGFGAAGTVGCSGWCRPTYAGCTGAATCGNGVIDAGEECDGSELGGASCTSLGYSGGTLACMTGCYLDRSACDASVAAGHLHTCAVRSNGAMRCWGNNAYGQLGIGRTDGSFGVIGNDEHPSSVAALSLVGSKAVRQVAGGSYHTCVILDGGTVQCWGHNDRGQLGLGTLINMGDNEAITPATQLNFFGAVAQQIDAGDKHTCVVFTDGSLRCFGINNYGQLGYNNDNADVGGYEPLLLTVPAAVVGGAVRQVATASNHTCVLLHNGVVRCWGYNANGELGLGHTNDVKAPNTARLVGDVSLGGPARQISASFSHTCALLKDNSVRCWGLNANGQLGIGNGSNVGDNELPSAVAAVALGQGAQQVVALGEASTCAVLLDRTVKCWGRNDFGALGYGNTTQLTSPGAAVSIGFQVKYLAGEVHHVCALGVSNDWLRCWGHNDNGQLGLANTARIGDNEVPSSQNVVSW